MNRAEAAMVLEERQVEWPATPQPPDAVAEVNAWSRRLAQFDVELVRVVVRDHVGQFGLTLSEVAERCSARQRGARMVVKTPERARECPTCGRSPFGPHQGQDPCRTCGRDDAPVYARMQSKELV